MCTQAFRSQAPGTRTGRRFNGQDGVALLLTLIALMTFSVLALYTSLSSTTQVRISDNHESLVHARQAALAGISHGRELLRGVDFNSLLKGADGAYSTNSTYYLAARTAAARNPLPWATARTIDVANPTSVVSTMADDGMFNTGKYGTTNGTTLVSTSGVAQTTANPYGSGTLNISRYFTKVSDNSGEASELAADAADNPFVDGDNTVIVRSMGISRTISEGAGGAARSNSVVVYEAKYHRMSTFNLDAPLIVEGNGVLPSAPNMFDGNSFRLNGGAGSYGIATIDTDRNTGTPLPIQLDGYLDPRQDDNIRGLGGSPSIGDITTTLTSPDQQLLLDANYLHGLVENEFPLAADAVYRGDQHWAGGGAPDLGFYDIGLDPLDPRQHPRFTYVDGDLDVQGNIDGGGVLVVRGKFTGGGSFTFNGLILILGEGEMDLSGLNMGINGGIFVANLTEADDGTVTFGTPKITMSGHSIITVNSDALMIARRLLPLKQLGLREISSRIDP